jgi:sulfite exporter TauE/SafE
MGGMLFYNLGRITTYNLLGLFFGLIGRIVSLAGFQQYLSIALGLFILLYVILPYFHLEFPQLSYVSELTIWVQTLLGKLLRKPTFSKLLFIGMLNGLLPCGMVYFAVAGALATGSIGEGWLFMIVFGIGTVPLLALLSYFGFLINLRTRNFLKKLIPVALGLMDILLIFRGMNLGIPYLSPYLSGTSRNVITCH